MIRADTAGILPAHIKERKAPGGNPGGCGDKAKKRKAEGGGLREMLLNTQDALSTAPCVEILSNRRATVQGSKGILEYGDELIRVSLSGMEVRFYGQELSIGCLSRDGLEITGKIQRLEYL